MKMIVVQSGLCVTAIAATIIGIHTFILYALNQTYVYSTVRLLLCTGINTYIHALQLNYRGNGRRAP
jgi:hypothetical protein